VIAVSSVEDERIRVGMILKNAVKYGYIAENPARKIEKIRTPEKPQNPHISDIQRHTGL